MGQRLKLTVDSYDQPVKEGDPIRRSRGDLFEANDAAEAKRLIEIGAALDPDEAAKQEAARIEAERAQLQSQIDALEAQSDALDSPQGEPAAPGQLAELPEDLDELKGKDLDDALEGRGLSKAGTVDEKRQRLADWRSEQG